MEDHEGKEVDNVDEAIDIEDKLSEHDCKRTQTTEYSTQAFITSSQIQNMVAAEKQTTKSNCKSVLLAGTVEDTLISALPFGYDHPKKGVNTPSLNLKVEVIVDTVQQKIIDSLLMHNIKALIQPDRFMDALMRQVSG